MKSLAEAGRQALPPLSTIDYTVSYTDIFHYIVQEKNKDENRNTLSGGRGRGIHSTGNRSYLLPMDADSFAMDCPASYAVQRLYCTVYLSIGPVHFV